MKSLSIALDKQNYLQMLFVFLIFLLMVTASYLSISIIVSNHLVAEAEEVLRTTEANIETSLREPETTLVNSAFTVQDMIAKEANQQEILSYLVNLTDWLISNDKRVSGFNGVYGLVRGDYLDGMRWEPPEDYVPEERPWYIAAKGKGGEIAATVPYVDAQTGEVVISYAQELFAEEGRTFLGILSIDMLLNKVADYVKNLHIAKGGYGVLLNQNLEIMAYPVDGFLNLPLESINDDCGEIARRLMENGSVSAFRVKQIMGGQTAAPGIVFFKRIFNGWYVGIVTPVQSYNRDVYTTAIILSVLGIGLMLCLMYLLLRLSRAKMRSDEESKSKSNFLARMSHEIRTPMNAILGLSELTLREKLTPQAREHVGNIRQAGDNLLSLINDILDFSKIESGKIEIVEAEYMFASLINDSISIIRTRLGEKPIQFITQIDGSLPSILYGDEARLRQVLLNLLSNAVKYTREGSITFTVRSSISQSQDSSKIILVFEIADTGIGIKGEDMGRLFGNFEQMDTKTNRGIEGTGLGLAISRNLCRLMGGDITVKSAYGKGSTFIASIPQTVRDFLPFAYVEAAETKNALVFVEGNSYGASVVYTVDNLGVGCTYARTREDFTEHLERVDWQFVFTSSNLFDHVRETLQKRNSGATLVLLVEYGKTARPDIHTLEVPVQPVAVANILNGKSADSGYHEIENPGVRFTAPEARILIVDDIETNLNVAAGLLAPYKMRIDKSSSGLEAIELTDKNQYDLIFMDHMMPGMDGIEAVAKIREREEKQRKNTLEFPKETPKVSPKGIPIVALTANAVSGMKEMFLEKGFNDYLSKPIETAKLDELISRWIPEEKRIKTGPEGKRESFNGDAGISIPGIDAVKGINMTGGTLEGYKKVLTSFYKDALDRLPQLGTGGEAGSTKPLAEVPAEKELAAFTIHVHALKSAAATIGAAELSKEAAELEAAGKTGTRSVIEENLPGFYRRLKETAAAIQAALATERPNTENTGPLLNIFDPVVRSLFLELKTALEAKDMETIDRLSGELAGKKLDKETMETLNAVSDLLLVAKFKAAAAKLDEILADKENL